MKKERKAGERSMEKHYVSRSEIAVERHFGNGSISIEQVIGLVKLLERDIGGGEFNWNVLSAGIRLKAVNMSTSGMI